MSRSGSLSTESETVDLSDQRFWQRSPEQRLDYFRRLRKESPVSRHGGKDGLPEFWALVRYDDVRGASRAPSTFSSTQGLILMKELPGQAAHGASSPSIAGMDDPEHARVRSIVQAAFSVRQVKQLEAQIQADARTVVAELEPGSGGDFVEQVARRLPAMTISRMLGVPEAARDEMLEHVDAIASVQQAAMLGEDAGEIGLNAAVALAGHAYELAQRRRSHPGESDDLMNALVTATVDGQQLDDTEIATFMILLCFAGNDTTRNATSHGLRALMAFPGQRRWLLDDLEARLPTAIEEIVRFSSPVMHFMRTAMHDTEVGGQPIAAGEKVVMFYSSANRDEQAFDRPDELDLSRTPNRHVGFGGGGPHFCLGAMLARAELRAILGELLRTYPAIEVGEPEYVLGNLINGIGSMPMDLGARAS